MKTCKATGKRCYASERSARKAMGKASNRVRVYRCGDCHELHVTARAGR